jgi:hypothetical protein
MIFNTSNSFAQDIKVVIMLGQSNMVGTGGRLCDLDTLLQKHPNITLPSYYIWENNLEDRIDSKQWKILGSRSSNGVKETLFHGSELALGYQLKQLRPNTDFAFIKIAKGGTSLASDWNSSPNSEGYMFRTFRRDFEEAITIAKNALPITTNIEVIGVMWMQGETDAMLYDPKITEKQNIDQANRYKQNLINFIVNVRKVISDTEGLAKSTSFEIPFVLGLITDQNSLYNACTTPEDFNIDSCSVEPIKNSSNYYTSENFIQQIRHKIPFANIIQQNQISTCLSTENCHYFETKHYQRGCGYDNGIHYNSNGLNQMGIDFANTLILNSG